MQRNEQYGEAGLGKPGYRVGESGAEGGEHQSNDGADRVYRARSWRETDLPSATTDPIHDPVNHPSHYTADPSGVECIQITRHRNFNIGNAIKYLWRAGLKNQNAEIEDLRKAVFYIVDEIDRLEGR